jgi:uncharacterized cupredoxin-like copper-binding protein
MEEKMRLVSMKVLITVFILALTACSGGQPQVKPVTIDVDMTEYAFNPASLELEVGQQVTLNLTNSGQLPHEIMFGRDVMMMNNRPAGYQMDMFEAGGVEPQISITEEGQMGEEMEAEEEHGGFMVVLGAGGRGSMTFTVTEAMAGEWEMGCFEQDGVHYDAGMHGPVTISR